MADADLGDKKHDATPERVKKFHKEGRFARAKDAGPLAATLAVIAALLGTSQEAGAALQLCFVRAHGDLAALTRGDGSSARNAALTALVVIAVPAAIAAAIGGTIAGAAQAGISFDLGRLEFKGERLDPLPRLQRLFSPKQALLETTMAVLRVGLLGMIAYRTLRDELPGLLGLTAVPAVVALHRVAAASLQLLLRLSATLAVLAFIDYAQSRFMLAREMKMSTQELKEEHRSQDGDPKVRGRIRARARALARRRMMNDVKKAAVVVTNPTHVAVALRYHETDSAPTVVAKGHDEVALRIRTEARQHGIPIVESRGLARMLDADVPVGHPIAGAHFTAVAQVLAFVYRLRRRSPRRGTPLA